MKKEAMKFTDKAVELFKDVYDISGGSVVVTELPDVGEEHVVYELQEKKVSQSLVPMFNKQMREDGVLASVGEYTFVFITSEEMTNTFNSIVPTEESGDIYLNYITEEDKLIGAVYVKGAWKFTEARKMSNCKFSVGAIFELEDDEYVVILKEYTGEVQGGIGYHGVLFNDEPYLFEQKTTGILLGTPTIGRMYMCACEMELPEIPEDFPSEYVFEGIPYEKIINYQLFDGSDWIFTPKSEEVTEISYWIYSNDTWSNMDEIGNVGTIYVSTDSFEDLMQEKFYGNGKELDVEFVDTTPEGAEVLEGYAIIKGVPIDTPIELTVSELPRVDIAYNNQWFSQEGPNTVIGAGHMVVNFSIE